MSKIAIVDYQMGNLRSVQKALEHVGYQAEVTSEPDKIRQADKVILPGVGAFGDAIRELRERDLVQPIQDAIAADKPFLGICLGLQLLFDYGLEGVDTSPSAEQTVAAAATQSLPAEATTAASNPVSGDPVSGQLASRGIAGLGILRGHVERFPLDINLKVPHMGWNQCSQAQGGVPLLNDVPDEAYFYFVHSYYVVPDDLGLIWLQCDYGINFCAAIRRGNLFATQFHPEKSQQDGLQLLKNFAEL